MASEETTRNTTEVACPCCGKGRGSQHDYACLLAVRAQTFREAHDVAEKLGQQQPPIPSIADQTGRQALLDCATRLWLRASEADQ